MTTRRTIPITLTGTAIRHIRLSSWGLTSDDVPDGLTARVAILSALITRRGRGWQASLMLTLEEAEELYEFLAEINTLRRDADRVGDALTAHAEGV